jgi:DNA-binding response OmpR family regulator
MPSIIIAEDDQMISEIYQKKFEEAGFSVFPAEAGEKVLSLAKEEKIDVILLDLILPKMDGFEIIKNLRSGEYDPDIKIIVFSNLNQNEDREKAMRLGANGFVVKAEYTPSNLVKEIERLASQLGGEKINGEKNREALPGEKKKDFKENEKKKILLIDDEEVFLEMFGERLRQDGFEVDVETDGASGVKKALAGDYDLFILDVVVTNMTGDEMVERLKMEEKTKNIPIIVMSASGEDEIVEKMKQMGINLFIPKTEIVPSELSKTVAEILKS